MRKSWPAGGGKGAASRRAGWLAVACFTLAACSTERQIEMGLAEDPAVNTYPTNYKTDILAGMHAYLNDPTGIRDAFVSDPMLKPVGGTPRYVVCLRFNGKRTANVYAGNKEVIAVFLVGRFDRFVEMTKETRDTCTQANYAPFPELEKLAR
jgi:hypothetical protein